MHLGVVLGAQHGNPAETMTLSDRFTAAPVPDGPAPRRVREAAPKGFEPGVRVDSDGSTIVTVPPVTELLEDESAWRQAVESLGITVPPGWAVRLIEMRHDPAAWTREAQGEDAVTKPVWRYRFRVEPAGPSAVDLESLIKVSRRARERKAVRGVTGEHAFLVAIGDTQFGKVDGDGIEGTIGRVLDSTQRAVDRLKVLRKQGAGIGSVYITWLGDCIEGFVSQGGGNAWRTPTTLTEQVRVVRRLMLEQVDAFRQFAPLVLASVPGNHDEAVRFGKQTTRYDDSWAVESAVAVSDAMEINPKAYGDCSVVVPGRDELTLTLDMAGTITGLAHGHQIKAGKGEEWWAGQAHGMQPIGEATVLLTAHFHHFCLRQQGPKTWIQVPAMEDESAWWRHRTGQVAPSGIFTALVGGGGWNQAEIV
jgi:hypothetical protein